MSGSFTLKSRSQCCLPWHPMLHNLVSNVDSKVVVQVLVTEFSAAACEICCVEGEETVNDCTTRKWFQRLKFGTSTFQTNPGLDVYQQKMKSCIKQLKKMLVPALSTQKPSSACLKVSCVWHLHELGFSSNQSWFIFHVLTYQQAQKSVDVCHRLQASQHLLKGGNWIHWKSWNCCETCWPQSLLSDTTLAPHIG